MVASWIFMENRGAQYPFIKGLDFDEISPFGTPEHLACMSFSALTCPAGGEKGDPFSVIGGIW